MNDFETTNELGLDITASTGSMEMVRSLTGTTYLRTGSPEELIEILGHLRQLIAEGHTPMYMEALLMSWGYQSNLIRHAFRKLTGNQFENSVNLDYMFSPGTIPQFSCAWGKGKKGDEVFFIMPNEKGFSIYHQVDDMTRREDSRYVDLLSAAEAMRKKVKKMQRWNPPVDEKKKDAVLDTTQLYRQPQLFMSASVKSFAVSIADKPVYEKKGMIKLAFSAGNIQSAEYDALIKWAEGEDKEKSMEKGALLEKLKDSESDIMKTPLDTEIAEKSPADFFERQRIEHKYMTIPADVVDAVIQYVYKAGEDLSDFSLDVKSFKYSSIQPSRVKSPTDEPDVLNAVASVSVLLEVLNKTGKSGKNKKLGLMVFSVIDSELHTTDNIKAEDDAVYALSNEGLAKMFQLERSMGG